LRIVSIDELINYKNLPFDIFNDKGKKIFEAGELLTPGKILQLKYIQNLYVAEPEDMAEEPATEASAATPASTEIQPDAPAQPPPERKPGTQLPAEIKIERENEISIVPVHTQKVIKNEFKEVMDTFVKEGIKEVNKCLDIRDKIMDEILPEVDNILYKSQLRVYGDYNYAHGLNVAMLSTMLAEKLKLKQVSIQDITLAAMLHDIGKVRIPKSILEKQAYTPNEAKLIAIHPRLGHKIILEEMKLPENIALVALQHHERPDGSGYPYGISSEKITYETHIINVCNVYDDLNSGKAFVKVRNSKEAIKIMLELGSKWFMPDILYTFVHMTNYNES